MSPREEVGIGLTPAGSYDRIVVGAGTAGCVLATRLAADRGERVLVVEAGPDPGTETQVHAELDHGTVSPVGGRWDWGLDAAIVGERRGPISRGRVVGGSAQINDCGAWRPPATDLDGWSAAAGTVLWDWQSVAASFRALEADHQFGHHRGHGAVGPIPITRWPDSGLTPAGAGLVSAVMESGFPYCADLNSPGAHGIGAYPQNRRGRRRMSTARTHLDGARRQGRVEVRADTPVSRVLVERGRVVGIEVRGERVPGESVVLAAGAPLTAALLLRSGIGPADHLRECGIDVCLDLPGVGDTIRDQPGAAIPIQPTEAAGSPVWPRVQVAARLHGMADDPTASMYLSVFTGMSIPALDAIAGRSVPTLVMVGDLAPERTGSVRLASADPDALPRVDLGLFATSRDRRRMIDAYRLAWDVAHQDPFVRTVGAFALVDDELVRDDTALSGFLARTITSRWNLLGGACMGSSVHDGAVVDERCGVIGVEGLSVADTSIVPVALRAPAALTAMMIGHHAASLIR